MLVRTINKIVYFLTYPFVFLFDKLMIFLGFRLDPNTEIVLNKITIITPAGEQMITRLSEKSGIKRDFVIGLALGVLDRIVECELNNGTIEFVEPNGVNRETLDLLRDINGDECGTGFEPII